MSELLRASIRLKCVMKFVAVGLLALAALLAACGGGSAPAATPSTTPVSSVGTTLTPSPLTIADDEAWFRGVVTDMRDGRPSDGPLTMEVRVTEGLGGQAPGVGNVVGVVVDCGFCIPCEGQWSSDIDKGYNVEVLARWLEGQLTICPSPGLFAAPFGPTPTASPVYSGQPTYPPTPTP